ncbi:SDR family NAD(P)-dependent oxidoreductase [Paenibacillus hemerocallicola]|uniref:SDR family NAD(P)-dependent oxidoreductase n=1 Tax=Paenibacillus hemerocallicola TaxID=1172614 RepID=A0A5C4TIA8_9BACL|nr:SDR family NAD(P)-dependent oxidoreductase [Paenibacillus hemerocallicola]
MPNSCAETPFAGMSSYCSSKAGLNMFTECVNMEQQNAAYPVRLLVVYPGMIDTGMQSVARNSKADQLPTAHFFQQAYDEGVLATPEQTAEGIIRLLERGRQDACIVKQLD